MSIMQAKINSTHAFITHKKSVIRSPASIRNVCTHKFIVACALIRVTHTSRIFWMLHSIQMIIAAIQVFI